MNKRGSLLGFDILNFIPRAIAYIVIIIVALMFQGMVLRSSVDVIEGETKLMMTAFLQSPDGFIYSENGRAYPGVVDFERFNAKVIGDAFNVTSGDYLAYNISLYNTSGQLIKSIVWNKLWYSRWCVIAQSRAVGKGAAIHLTERYLVTVRYKDKSEPGILQIDIARPTR